MRFNLENAPKKHWDSKVVEWFEGFEAELRERILKCGWTECTIIKEILGE